MSRIPLLGNPYEGQSIIASAQECINLYGELNKNPQAPSPITYYLTPGLNNFAQSPNLTGKVRCSYRSSLDAAYIVIDTFVYLMLRNGGLSLIGTITDRPTQVIMADNGLVVILVDGVSGWAIDIATNSFIQIVDPNFYGASFVVFLDTFFVFNRPDTNQFYISLSQVDYAQIVANTAFDPLDIAAKSGSADPIASIATVHKELWLIGELTTEVWIGTGAADFYFQLQQGAYIDHGCIAPYSVTTTDVLVFFIMKDKAGSCIIVKGGGYELTDISTPFIVAEIKQYKTVTDAIGFNFQINDHAFYAIVFPTANKTWLYELKTGMWARWCWTDDNGAFNRHRANCAMFVYDKNYVGDWENGKIYELNPTTYTDARQPIVRVRTCPHFVGPNYERLTFPSLDVDIQCGTSDHVDLDTDPPEELPMISLSWSNDRGKTYSNPVEQSLGNQGEFLTTVSWNRLGLARDKVFKLQWSAAIETALNGIFIEVKKAKT